MSDEADTPPTPTSRPGEEPVAPGPEDGRPRERRRAFGCLVSLAVLLAVGVIAKESGTLWVVGLWPHGWTAPPRLAPDVLPYWVFGQAEARLEPVVAALVGYHDAHGRYPPELDALVREGLIARVPGLPDVAGSRGFLVPSQRVQSARWGPSYRVDDERGACQLAYGYTLASRRVDGLWWDEFVAEHHARVWCSSLGAWLTRPVRESSRFDDALLDLPPRMLVPPSELDGEALFTWVLEQAQRACTPLIAWLEAYRQERGFYPPFIDTQPEPRALIPSPPHVTRTVTRSELRLPVVCWTGPIDYEIPLEGPDRYALRLKYEFVGEGSALEVRECVFESQLGRWAVHRLPSRTARW